jgi:hypothetical protein
MNDLLSPILLAFNGEEVDSFWCFVNLMERVGSHFQKDHLDIQIRLSMLFTILSKSMFFS